MLRDGWTHTQWNFVEFGSILDKYFAGVHLRTEKGGGGMHCVSVIR